MFLIIVIFLLVVGVAFFQVTQGMYSAAIMAVLSVTSAMLAFNYYEPIAATLYDRQPAHADGAVLIGLFIISLLVLRLIFDRLFRSNAVTGVWTDRIAGGVLGLVSGLVVVGVLSVGVQMLPFGPTILGYRSHDDTLNSTGGLAPFHPDRFVLGMVSTLSSGSLKGTNEYGNRIDDLILDLQCARNRIEQERTVDYEDRVERIGRLDTPVDALEIMGVYEPTDQDAWMDEVPSDPRADAGGGRLVIVRVRVSDSARDEDNWWRLPATHFRLATVDDNGRPASYYPVAYLTAGEHPRRKRNEKLKPIDLANSKWAAIVPPQDAGNPAEVGKLAIQREWNSNTPNLTIDWVFRLSVGHKPAYMAFRKNALADAPKEIKDSMPAKVNALSRIAKN